MKGQISLISWLLVGMFKSLRAKFLMVSTAMLGVAVLSAFATKGLTEFYLAKSDRLRNRDLILLLQAHAYSRAFEDVQNQIEVALGVADKQIALEAIAQFESGQPTAHVMIEKILQDPARLQEDKLHVREFEESARSFVINATNPSRSSDDKIKLGRSLKQKTNLVRDEIKAILDRAQSNYDQTLQEIETYTEQVSARIPTVILGLLALTSLMMFFILRSAFQRLSKIQAHFLAADLDSLEPFPNADGGDELSVLASAANRMLDGFKVARTSLIEKDFVQTVFSSVKEAIIVVSREGKILLHNQAWTSMIGAAEPERAFRTISSSLRVDTQRGDTVAEQRSYRGSWISEDGTTLHLLASEATLVKWLGGLDATVIALTDISQLHQAEEEKAFAESRLAQSAKLASLGEMGVGIAHELNNPLTGIKGFAEIILNMPETSAKAREYLKTIIKASDRMRKIIDHIRKFGRTSRPDEMDVCDLRRIIEDAFIIQASQFAAHNIKVTLTLSDMALPLVGDASQLESVFHNLLSNSRDAFKSGPENGHKSIEISAQVDAEHQQSLVTIADNAGGIPPEVRAKIFDPFFTTKDVGVGTGLGLSIALGAIKRHEGTIELKSNTPGRAVFEVRLPYKRELSADAIAKETSENSMSPIVSGSNDGTGANKVKTPRVTESSAAAFLPRIAIVDDESDIRRLLVACLGGAFEVVTYGDPVVAAAEIPRANLAGVITDMRMPGMSGLELIKSLRSSGFTCPIIVISGHANTEDDIQLALESGAQLLIPKPFPRSNELISLIREVLAPPVVQSSCPIVVVVDDDELVVEMVREFLESRSFVCYGFLNLASCVRYLEGNPVDLVLCDLTMDGARPEEIVESVITAARGAPVLIMSGHSVSEPAVKAALASGAADMVTKPFALSDDLLVKVRRWLHPGRRAA